MVLFMFRQFCILGLLTGSLALAQDEALRKSLEGTYKIWRESIETRNDMTWKKVTASHRMISVKNRILSEKRKFPDAVFDLPAMPPKLDGLKHLGCLRSGPTANAYYYGPIDFGLGGKPGDNLLVLSFVGALSSWKFDQAEYINLAALPEVRKQLAAGDMAYITKSPELLPSGQVPPTPAEVPEAAYIAKVYVYCPGREVRVQVNQVSVHRFENTQIAEIVIGGARDGANQIQYAVKQVVPGEVNDPMTVRVYLFSEVQGVKPIKVFEYQVADGGKPVEFGKGEFTVDAKIRNQLMGR